MSHDQNSTMRQAGTVAALCDLGLTGHEKHAGIFGSAISAVNRAAGSPFSWAGRKLFGQLGRTGAAEGGALARAGVPEATRTGLLNWGKGLPAEMGGFGLLSGGIEAAMAEPGERGKAFARGFGTGALGGLGWGLGSRAISSGMRRTMPASRFEQLEKAKLWGKADIDPKTKAILRPAAARTPQGGIDWGERAKVLGFKALPTAGAFVASDAIMAPVGSSLLFNKQQPGEAVRPAYAYPQVYGPMVGMQPNDPYGMGTAGVSLVPRY